jgi:cell division transport system permease protein
VSLVAGDAAALLRPDAQADRVVPRTGQSARLTVFTSAAMAFLAVFALALSLASGRLADRWSSALAQSSTIRLSAPRPRSRRRPGRSWPCWSRRPASTAPA